MKRSTFSKKISAVIRAAILSIVLTGSFNTVLAQKIWSQVSSGTTNDLEAVAYNTNDGTLIAVGQSVILKSVDQGQTWSTVYSEGIHFYDTQVSMNNILHAVGSNGIKIRSSDNGVSWHTDGTSGSTVYYAEAFSTAFGSAGTGVTVGSWPNPDVTTDDGLSWTETSDGLTINKNYFGADYDGTNMLIVGGSGEIWKSTDLGNNWTKMTSGVNVQLRSVSSDHGSTIAKLVCGNNGTVLISNDGGDTWTNISPGISTNFRSAIYANNRIQVVGLGGLIISSDDGGANWFAENSSTSNDLKDIVEIDNGDLVAVGAGGTILVYSELTGVESTKNIPATFSLAQNYPNPFNPSTKIRYSIPHSSPVLIKVYDLIGNEIATLVNEEKPAGAYEVTWDARNLPSGIYFYQIRAGEFFQTNKMMLLK